MTVRQSAGKVNSNGIPEEMRLHDRWVGWRYEVREGKPTKVPINGMTGLPIDATDPKLWKTFADAMEAVGACDGVGFAMGGSPYAGADLDKCIDDAGVVAEWAMEIVRRLNSYTEITPSGRGLRVWVRGKLPPGRRRKGQIELYDSGRYFTVSGNHLEGTPTAIAERTPELAELHAETFPAGRPKARGPAKGGSPIEPGDADLLDRVRRARNGDKFSALYDRGDAAGYASGSEADYALLAHLAFWTDSDAARMERLFGASALGGRGKWIDRADYRATSIANAIEANAGKAPESRTRRNGAAPSANGNGHHSANGNGSGPFNRIEALGGGDDEPEVEVIDRWPKADPDVFHGIAGEIVRLADPHTEADPVAVLIQFLLAFGNMIGRGPHFVVGATRHYLNLFAVLVGPTAVGRKGSSWDIVEMILRGMDPDWARHRVQSGLVSGEGLIYHVRDPKEERPAKPGKNPPEAGTGDPGVIDKRLLVIESELSRTLKAMNRDSNTLSDVIRQAWERGNLGTMARNNGVVATDAHISIIAHTTQADVRRYLTETDSANGFSNRFLWPAARRSKELPDGGDLFEVDWAPIHRRLAGFVALARGVGKMARDKGASDIWHAVYGELSAGRVGLLGSVLSRGVPQVMRVACLYALLDGSTAVRAEHLVAALALWDYCEQSARLIFDALGNTDSEKLLSSLRAAPEGLAKTAIANDVFNKHRNAKEIAGMLSELLTAGMIHRRLDRSTGGRPAERWFAGKGEQPHAD
jgi:Protein of unknown function (DUF3987)